MVRTIAAKSITDFLTSPGRVAHSLDWRKCSGTILNIQISKKQIDLAIASHPSFEEPVFKLASIPIEEKIVGKNKKVLDERVAKELLSVIRDHHVCGMVVGFPVRPEGWCGAQCGRVLRVLDQLAAEPESGRNTIIFHESRPVCLYDPNNHVPTEDSWGRSALYSRLPPPDKTLHLASQEQYGESSSDDGQAVLKIWNNFCRTHWPEVMDQVKETGTSDRMDYDDLDEDSYRTSNGNRELAYSF